MSLWTKPCVVTIQMKPLFLGETFAWCRDLFPGPLNLSKKKFCEIFTFLTIGVKRINKGSAFLAQNIETRTGFLIYKLRSSSFEQ